MTAPPPGSAPPAFACAERLLAELRTEIARADAKASVLVAALSVAVGGFGGLLGGRTLTPPRLSTPDGALWWSGALALALALLSLLLAVLPRPGRTGWAPGAPLSYFGDICQAVRGHLLAEALADTDRAPTTAVLTALTENSRIAARKHQWIRTGLLSFCAGSVLFLCALLIG
ncbi:Pycsar system effector family protein [Streptomyces sp. NPDC001100]